MATPRIQHANKIASSDASIDAVTTATPLPSTLARTVISNVRPSVDGGRRPAKTTVGEDLRVEAERMSGLQAKSEEFVAKGKEIYLPEQAAE